MPITIRRSTLAVLVLMTILADNAHADSFEFLNYTPPPGWTRQILPDGVAYRRPTGIGLITFYPSYPATGSAAEEFAKLWRTQVAPALPGPAPQPQIQTEGEYTVAAGTKQISAQGGVMTLSLSTLIGRGRAIGVLTTSAGDESLREVAVFLSTLNIKNGTASAPALAAKVEVDFAVPPGYTSRPEGARVTLIPTTVDRTTPCAYGISPARPSHGTLEADARAALLEALPGWQQKSDSFNAMRGTSGAGWPYFWFRTDVQRLVGGSYEYATAMTMAFPGQAGSTNILWGVGTTGPCLLDDLAFARLFHSLRPRGWTTDGGKTLSRELHGTWRNSQRLGMAQYKFLPNGRYEFGIGTVTTTGLIERTSSSVLDGRYELRGSELTITPDRRDRGAKKYLVRIYDEYVLGRWTRAMSLLDENVNPALEVQYMRIDDSR